jgi:predicted flap endonuclease-1-like 5' DNA nuclease
MVKAARNLAALGAGLGISAVVGWLFLREHRRNRDDDAPILIKSQLRADAMDMPNIVLPLDAIDDLDTNGSAPVPTTGDESITAEGNLTQADDLTQINDIGPRFAEALRAIGITRYAQLAEQHPETLAKKLLPHVRVTAQRIQDKNWVGQAAQLASH